MRIAFMGTPDFAVPTLEALVAAGHEIACVYSQPPRPAGRGKAPRVSPVQQRAQAMGIEVRTPVSLRSEEAQAAFRALGLEAAVVAAYGLILPAPILEAPRLGCLNVHASLLPRWRGAAPVQRAILAGDRRTGVTIMQMERGLDTGPMLAQLPAEIARKSAGELTAELARLGAELMVDVLASIHRVGPRPQDDRWATYAPKIAKEEARLDFSRSAEEVERQVRAFDPVPGAFFEYAGERIKIHSAELVDDSGPAGTVLDRSLTIACGTGALAPTSVQRAGRAVMTPAELLRGFPIPPGTRL
ncbi:MAG: methionyl-tRNA formyltransferase [Alphaproteobacteria bacterium]|nr:methionyl-tRNA formyltransferase [Alphaproteobacteria bacterium]MBV9371243.1 methionyl-tRNA formyltransferase [Alphaproteobacteria bacterium]MBV9902818.1 methionyl-tRNA formyltransferase [Alphaproteobacteria bacterium]